MPNGGVQVAQLDMQAMARLLNAIVSLVTDNVELRAGLIQAQEGLMQASTKLAELMPDEAGEEPVDA